MKIAWKDLPRHASMVRWLFFVALIFISGCGGTGSQPNYAELGLVEITGTIRLDGMPLANAFVQFEDEDGSFCYSDVDSQGRYRLRFDSKTYGTIPGKKIVRIRMGQSNIEGTSADSDDPDLATVPVSSPTIKIPACYNLQSGLTKQVTKSESNVDFDLRSDGVSKSAP